jgi:hypothetical protein
VTTEKRALSAGDTGNIAAKVTFAEEREMSAGDARE